MPSSVVVIGKKELFAFAERYAAVKLRDYSALTDGHVLCLLFNQIFPQHTIRPAPPETHSPSQRTQQNWESLFRRLVRVAIPVALLDPIALSEGSTEAGFSALVLFYFLFHLTRRMDFSAEFALDLPEKLTQFLQSADCVASLLIGEAVSWECVPDALGDQVRDLPSFHTTPEEERAQEEEAVRHLRAQFQGRSSDRTARPSPRHTAAQHVLVGPDPSTTPWDDQRAVEEAEEAEQSGFDHRDVSAPPSAPSSHHSSSEEGSTAEEEHSSSVSAAHHVADKLREEKRALIRHAAQLQRELTMMRASHRQLEVERDALLELETEREKEIVTLRDENHQLQQLTAQRLHSRSASPRQAEDTERHSSTAVQYADTLLDDIMDPETGAAIDVHERANMLHCLLIAHMRDNPQHRAQGQHWLWSLLSAYHVLETRLVTAVDVIKDLQHMTADPRTHVQGRGDRSPTSHHSSRAGSQVASSTANTQGRSARTRGPTSEGSTRAWQRLVEDCHQKLTEAHAREHTLMQDVASLETALHTTEQCMGRREALWRSLCEALHTAEQASLTVAGSESSQEVERLLHTRDAAYDAIETTTAALLRDTLPTHTRTQARSSSTASSSSSRVLPVSSPCRAAALQLDLLREENAVLRRQWRRVCQIAERGEEEEETDDDGAASDATEQGLSPSTLVERSSVEERIAQQRRYEETAQRLYRSAEHGVQETPNAAKATRDVSPYAKSLLKLLAEASSPSSSPLREGEWS